MHETLKQKLTFSIGIKRLLSCLQPHCLMANSGIVLQAETVMVHLVLSSKKTFPPYFILLFVWEHLKEIEALND